MSLLTPPVLPDLSRITAIYESSAASTEYGAPVRYGYYAIEARARLLDQGIGDAKVSAGLARWPATPKNGWRDILGSSL